MESPKGPWTPTKEALELSFERQTLLAFRNDLRAFADKNGITYRIETKDGSLRIFPEIGDFTMVAKRAGENADVLNELLLNQKKNFYIEVEGYNNGLQINALRRKGA